MPAPWPRTQPQQMRAHCLQFRLHRHHPGLPKTVHPCQPIISRAPRGSAFAGEGPFLGPRHMRSNLETALDRLQLIDRQDALLLLRCSLGSPKLMYLLRCAPCYDHLRLIDYDKLLRGGMERILNISLTEDQWMQASLPIRMGGLGVRRVSSLALPAFLASAAGTLPVQSLILGPTWNGEDASFDCAQADWLRITGIEDPATCPGHKQSLWDKPLLLKALSSFRERLHDPYDWARLNASMAPHASDWPHALPLTTFNLKLSDEAVRVAVGLRLGSAICEPHTCVCGASVSAKGSHGLSCSLGFGRQARHSNINDIIPGSH